MQRHLNTENVNKGYSFFVYLHRYVFQMSSFVTLSRAHHLSMDMSIVHCSMLC